MKVDVYSTFNYNKYAIQFKKQFEFAFPPFYDMVLRDYEATGPETMKIVFSNAGRSHTEIIYNAYGTVTYTVITLLTWDMPVEDVVLDALMEKYEKFGWVRGDIHDIDEIKKTMREQTAMTEAYNAPVGRKA